MKLLTTILIGAAIAGVIYYLKDNEEAKKAMGKVKDAASDAFNSMSNRLGKVHDKVNSTVG